MAVFERTVWVDAPLEEVWKFHSRIEGLETLTPSWFHLRVESVTGPDGSPDPDELVPGTEIRMSMQPGGIGPRQRWTSRILEREATEESAYFTDEMTDGPFSRWHHTHRFYAEDGGTRIIDRVEYAVSLGPVRGLSVAARPVLDLMFAARHRRTKTELE